MMVLSNPTSLSPYVYIRISKSVTLELRCVANVDSRRRLHSISTSALDVPPTRLVSIGDRAFGATAWNSLPPVVTTSSSVSVFK